MINERYANVLFGLTTVLMLLANIQHSIYISDNLGIAEEYYFGGNIGIIITCIFANICLGIFALFILGNLSDFVQKMTVNLIGARQKLRILAILILVSFLFYSGSSLICFMKAIRIFGILEEMAIVGLAVSILQLLEIFSISLIHNDVLGINWIKEMKNHDKIQTHYL